jgi:hypothetical protein
MSDELAGELTQRRRIQCRLSLSTGDRINVNRAALRVNETNAKSWP